MEVLIPQVKEGLQPKFSTSWVAALTIMQKVGNTITYPFPKALLNLGA